MKYKSPVTRRIIWGAALFFGVFVAIILTFLLRPVVSKARLLREFHLPISMVFDIENYAYWNDFLKYTDGYEIARIRVDADQWEKPDIWNVGESTLFEILRPYSLGYSSALSDEFENGEIPVVCQQWYAAEKKPNGNSDGWEFFVGAYDGDQSIFLYRGHHLYGSEDLRITGESMKESTESLHSVDSFIFTIIHEKSFSILRQPAPVCC